MTVTIMTDITIYHYYVVKISNVIALIVPVKKTFLSIFKLD